MGSTVLPCTGEAPSGGGPLGTGREHLSRRPTEESGCSQIRP